MTIPVRLIRKDDKDGMQIQELLEQLGIQFEVTIVSTGKTPEIVLEDDTRYTGYLRTKSFCDQLAPVT